MGEFSAPDPLAANPFLRVRTRYLFLGLLLTVVPAVLAYEAIEDPTISELFLNLWIYGTLMIWAVWAFTRHGVSLRRLVGPRPRGARWLLHLLHAVPLVLVSIGGSVLLLYSLSYIAPGVVEWILEDVPVFLGPEQSPQHQIHNVLIIVGGSILAPVVEELIFRGVLLHRWAAKWGTPRAVWISSILFGIGHVDVLGALIFGYALCAIYIRTRSLWVPILIHVVNNASAFAFAALFPDSGPTTLESFRGEAWIGLVCLALAIPWLVWFALKLRPDRNAPLPYFATQI